MGKKKKKVIKKTKSQFKIDQKQFPNFPRQMYYVRGKSSLVKISLIAYIIKIRTLKGAQLDDFWVMKDVYKGFRKKYDKRFVVYDVKNIPNLIFRIHIFEGHNCIGEIDYRGLLWDFESDYENISCHIEEVLGTISMRN